MVIQRLGTDRPTLRRSFWRWTLRLAVPRLPHSSLKRAMRLGITVDWLTYRLAGHGLVFRRAVNVEFLEQGINILVRQLVS